MAGRASMPEGVLIVNATRVSHPFASVISTSHRPGQRPETLSVPWPCGGAGVQRKVCGPLPPTVSTTATPSQAPQPESVMESCGSSGEGSEIVKASTVSQPT